KWVEPMKGAAVNQWPNRYEEPFPSPQKPKDGGIDGWLRFDDFVLTIDPKNSTRRFKSDIPAAEIAAALKLDVAISTFSTDGTTRKDIPVRAAWQRKKGAALFVRESAYKVDLIETGILLWRIIYKDVYHLQQEFGHSK